MEKTTKYSPWVRDRAVRMVFEQQKEHGLQWSAIGSIAGESARRTSMYTEPGRYGSSSTGKTYR
ncbi:MAG TPA: hypothetical protein VLH56_00555 [Dissulfurispiraceae bacterium]|nr:hypothetical protein [Dissulfurispiraceae bacterium]